MSNMLDSNNYIEIGESTLTWRFQKIKCTVTCANAELLNSFDKVICGLLSIDEALSIEQLGYLMGLNVIDNPASRVYKDNSEYNILAAAIRNLEQYELISNQVLPFETITRYSLTEKGKLALITGKKFSYEMPEVDVFIDKLFNNKESYKYLPMLDATPIDNDSSINMEEVSSIVSIQHPDLVDNSKGKTVDNIYVNESSSFEVVLHLSILYDYRTKNYFINCNSLNGEHISAIINQHYDVKNAILSEFFNGFEESVIYKPKYQFELEDNVRSNTTDESDKLFYGVQDFYKCLDEEIPGDALEVYFFLPYMDEKFHEIMSSFAQHRKHQIICAEFVNGEDKFIDYTNDNLIYRKTHKLRTDSLCVCDTNVFYTPVDFVIDYESKSYSLKIVTKSSEVRYRTDILKSTTLSRTIESISRSLCTVIDDIIAKPTRKSILYIINRGNCLHTYSGGECQNNELFNVYADKVQVLVQQWKERLLNEIENIRVSLLNKSDYNQISTKLADVESQCKDLAEDLIPQINEIKKTIRSSFVTVPKVMKQHGFVLDTSVYMEDPYILKRIDQTKFTIILPQPVKEELDDIDHSQNEVKKEKAHIALGLINSMLRDRSPLLLWEMEADLSLLPNGFNHGKKDNHIMCAALKYERTHKFESVGIVIKDGNFETDAWGLGLKTYTIDQFLDFLDGKNDEFVNLSNFEMPDDLWTVLVSGYNNCLKNSKEVLMGMLVSSIKAENPGFSTTLYGFSKFKELCEAFPSLIKVYRNKSQALCVKLLMATDSIEGFEADNPEDT